MPSYVKDKITYICPYCKKEYDDIEDAVFCRDECVVPEVDNVILKHRKNIWLCNKCDKEFNNESEASRCELNHAASVLGQKRLTGD